MILPNPTVAGIVAVPISKADTAGTAERLTNSLAQHSDHDLLLLLMGQVVDAKAEIRVLQATVNTLLIELCHRQPEKLSQVLTRISNQRFEELLTQVRSEADAFRPRGQAESPVG